ncbi:ATP synthase F0 complex subunit b [Candidatus Bealeia paramacronuclearis]|uniref:ATP synthase subunit b n=1 Tax=Candidatus Bealeia paramacronuclearis TaxID=1921001 RepID=A0ABZ2C4I9_9PROT|nr:ATP synthase F0 complex subunit b [Candidatus Bealeia paramacronuclearis]
MMFETPEFWVLISFILLLAVLGKRAWKELITMIDERTHRIEKQLSEAQRLHDEALSLLHTYQTKHEAAMQQAIEIVSRAEADAIDLKRSIEEELTDMLTQKEKSTHERIQIAQETAKNQLKEKVVEEALSFVEEILSAELQKKGAQTNKALDEIGNIALSQKVA